MNLFGRKKVAPTILSFNKIEGTQATDLENKSAKSNGGISPQVQHATLGDASKPPEAPAINKAEVSLRQALTERLAVNLRLSTALIIDKLDELVNKVAFLECINARIGIAHHLSYSVAVVNSATEAKRCIFLAAPTVEPEDINGIATLLSKAGWGLVEGSNVWLVSSSLVVAVAQGHVKNSRIESMQKISNDQDKAALWQSFVDVIQWGFDNQSNDIDFVVRAEDSISSVAFKIDGLYIYPGRWKIPTRTMVQILGIAYQRGEGGREPAFNANIEQQCLVDVDLAEGDRVRLRWSGMRADVGTIVTLRMQRMGASTPVKNLAEAGYMPSQIAMFERAISNHGGLTVLSGTVGTGKSLTLSILMSMLPPNIKMISLEDPVEFHIPNVHQRTIVRDLLAHDDADFAAAVRALLRSALDGLLFGEVRDVAAGRVVRAILESGHDIYTTVHARDALGIFARLSSPEINIPKEVLAAPGNVKLCVYQTLISRVCEHCKLTVDEVDLGMSKSHYYNLFESVWGKDLSLEELRFRNPKGCKECEKPELSQLNGYQSRCVVAEMVEPNEDLSEILLHGTRLDLARWWRELSDKRMDSENFTGKTANEVAIFKSLRGEIDPRDVEGHFVSFETLQKRKEMLERQKHIRKVAA
ncbi:MAG: ATPase, T2SS/T4P/T4SS family [Gammaproteobacteria bacterium]|nr:ATPase, T2SS/T4P/T4SS family [Gammaproteobacteria bacterium]